MPERHRSVCLAGVAGDPSSGSRPLMPGKKYRSIKRPKVYERLRRKGMSKRKAARISNAKKRKK